MLLFTLLVMLLAWPFRAVTVEVIVPGFKSGMLYLLTIFSTVVNVEVTF